MEDSQVALRAAKPEFDVAVDNHGAQQLYERLGFVVEATSPRSAILPEGQVHRMAALL